MKDLFQIVLINYANDLFRSSQKVNSKSGEKIGLFSKVISYNPTDIDANFKNKNKKILEQKRGNGYWLWKPYFIKKTLEDLDWGDYLFYCDSGSYFIDSVHKIISLSQKSEQDIIPFELTHLESEWTKRDAFVFMECDSADYYNTKQRLASFILIKKTELSIQFIEEWMNFALDERILTDIDNVSGFENYPNFKDHRHDQSIFSLLSKKYGFKAYRDPSQFGNAVKELYSDSNYEQIFILNRKRNLSIKVRIKKYLQNKKNILKKLVLQLTSDENNK